MCMAVEIERRFLLKSDDWRHLATRCERLTDGLVASSDGRKVRVRQYGNRATLTVKSMTQGLRRAEFEYEIPFDDATTLLTHHCGNLLLEKTRYCVTYGRYVWEVDVYHGLLEGVVMAEVELASEDQSPPLPEWIGEEVTGDARYKKINMLRDRLAAVERQAGMTAQRHAR